MLTRRGPVFLAVPLASTTARNQIFPMPILSRSETLQGLPPISLAPPCPAKAKIVVLDDDPTGTQTVHGVPILTGWEVADLEEALNEPGPCFFVLTNTRAFPPERARRINRDIGRNLTIAAQNTGRDFTVISRGDSTLRGHFPGETDALIEGLGLVMDGTLLVPAFFSGGRLTIDDIHYVTEGDRMRPVGETEFAGDRSFGYRSSNLREWVEEKTAGRIRARDVVSISIADIRLHGAKQVAGILASIPRGGVAIVNAADPADLAIVTWALADKSLDGRRYLFRTAADFVAAYAAIPKRPLLTARELARPDITTGGLIIAGSYVGKTSAQLEALFHRLPDLARVEISVPALLEGNRRTAEIQRCIDSVERHHTSGRSVALFTSRLLITGQGPAESLAIGEIISSGVVDVVRSLAAPPRWLISKGGITSSDIATRALRIRRATGLGQALPGVPVWMPGPDSKWPGLPYIIFPGNVGDSHAVATLVASLEAARSDES